MGDEPRPREDANNEAKRQPENKGASAINRFDPNEFFVNHWKGVLLFGLFLLLVSPIVTFPGGNPRQLWWVFLGVCLAVNFLIWLGFKWQIDKMSAPDHDSPPAITAPLPTAKPTDAARSPSTTQGVIEMRLPGFCVLFYLRINHLLTGRRQYLFDFGHADGERLSAYISADHIFTLAFVDAKGEPHLLQIPFGEKGFPLGRFVNLFCELGISGEATLLRLRVDERCIGSMTLPFRTDIGSLDIREGIIGADLMGSSGARFDALAIATFQSTLPETGGAEYAEAARKSTWEAPTEFDGNSWMRIDGMTGDLRQSDPTKAPQIKGKRVTSFSASIRMPPKGS